MKPVILLLAVGCVACDPPMALDASRTIRVCARSGQSLHAARNLDGPWIPLSPLTAGAHTISVSDLVDKGYRFFKVK